MSEQADAAIRDETGAPSYPPGEYAIVEIMGHTTMVGRIQEIERFGTKMLAIEPLFNGEFLTPVYQGGSSIYRLTPCSAEIAYREMPKKEWQLPTALRVIVPANLLPPPETTARDADTGDYSDREDIDDHPF